MCNKLFTAAGFTNNQRACRRSRNGLNTCQHRPEGGTLADNPSKVHRHLHFFAQIVALILKFIFQAGDLTISLTQFRLMTITLGNVFARNEHTQNIALYITLCRRRHQDIKHVAGMRHHLTRHILGITGIYELG